MCWNLGYEERKKRVSRGEVSRSIRLSGLVAKRIKPSRSLNKGDGKKKEGNFFSEERHTINR